MVHDAKLLDILSSFEPEKFSGRVFRAVRNQLNPLAFSTNGGRWAPRGKNEPLVSVLYTSLQKEGAIAELAYHWGSLNPKPKRSFFVHKIEASTSKTLRLLKTNLESLGIENRHYFKTNYSQTQKIGAAVSFLGFDGLIVPSARWDCENLVLYENNHNLSEKLKVLGQEEVPAEIWHKYCKTSEPRIRKL